jgi:hypothetical protein
MTLHYRQSQKPWQYVTPAQRSSGQFIKKRKVYVKEIKYIPNSRNLSHQSRTGQGSDLPKTVLAPKQEE